MCFIIIIIRERKKEFYIPWKNWQTFIDSDPMVKYWKITVTQNLNSGPGTDFENWSGDIMMKKNVCKGWSAIQWGKADHKAKKIRV